jgi:hypothetical protein
VRFNAVFRETRVVAKMVMSVEKNLMQGNGDGFAFWVGNNPLAFIFLQGIWGVHPVEGFIGSAVGVNSNTPVGFHHNEARGFIEARLKATNVMNTAASDK